MHTAISIEAQSVGLDPHPISWRIGQGDCAVINHFAHVSDGDPGGRKSHIRGGGAQFPINLHGR